MNNKDFLEILKLMLQFGTFIVSIIALVVCIIALLH